MSTAHAGILAITVGVEAFSIPVYRKPKRPARPARHGKLATTLQCQPPVNVESGGQCVGSVPCLVLGCVQAFKVFVCRNKGKSFLFRASALIGQPQRSARAHQTPAMSSAFCYPSVSVLMLAAARELYGPECCPPDRYAAKRPQIALQLEQKPAQRGEHYGDVSLRRSVVDLPMLSGCSPIWSTTENSE
jgi:hypothetical protein